jgi:hypothetical protein
MQANEIQHVEPRAEQVYDQASHFPEKRIQKIIHYNNSPESYSYVELSLVVA